LAQNAETSTDRDGNDISVTTPSVPEPAIYGMQGQTWSETIRTDDQYYEMAFPRVLAVAERAWHRASWELNWSPGTTYNTTTDLVPKNELADDYNGFVTKLGCNEVFKLQKLGINYRIAPPGASIDAAGVLTANSEMPCTLIMYSLNEGSTWLNYSGPVEVGAGKAVHLQSVSSGGSLKSRVVVAGEECVDCGGNGSAEQSVPDPDNSLSSGSNVLAGEECVDCGQNVDIPRVIHVPSHDKDTDKESVTLGHGFVKKNSANSSSCALGLGYLLGLSSIFFF